MQKEAIHSIRLHSLMVFTVGGQLFLRQISACSIMVQNIDVKSRCGLTWEITVRINLGDHDAE